MLAVSGSVAEFVKPAYFWLPDRAGSFGQEAIDLAAHCGLNLDPEQKLVIDAFLSHDEHGDWVASEVCIIEARQNGKTGGILVPIALWDLFLGPDPDMVIWTAHRFKTTHESFLEMKSLIDGTFELRRRVKRITEAYGSEQIELTSGARMEFLARSRSGGRGLGGKRPILDEGFAVQQGQIGALLPTILARPNAQIMYASSAGLEESAPLREVRDRGRAGGDRKLVYVEWCAPGSWAEPGCELRNCNHHRDTPGCALDRQDNVRAANPAYGRRIKPDSVYTMRRSLSPHEYGREVLGWWDEPIFDDVSPISLEDWNKCADPDSHIVGPIVLAIDVARWGSSSAIAACGYRPDGVAHGELIKYAGGTDWVVPEISRLMKKFPIREIVRNNTTFPAIVMDPASSASALLPDLHKAGIFPILMTAREMAGACGDLQSAVDQGPSVWCHLGQQQVGLAVEGAVRRDVGDGGWAFGRKKSAESQVDICTLVSITAARWGLTIAKVPSDGPSAYIV